MLVGDFNLPDSDPVRLAWTSLRVEGLNFDKPLCIHLKLDSCELFLDKKAIYCQRLQARSSKICMAYLAQQARNAEWGRQLAKA